MAIGRLLEITQNLFPETDRESSFALLQMNHANIILNHNAFGSFACIILIGDQCVPGVYLSFAAILDLASRWTPKHNFNTRNGFVVLKLVGLEVLL